MGDCTPQNIGNAGEYYLASILSAKNYVVTITLGRNEKYDLLAVSPQGKTTKISVKTKQGSSESDFILSQKDETVVDDLFYGFVRLNDFKKEPDFWIVPSRIVAHSIKRCHSIWLSIPGKRKPKSLKNTMRKFRVEGTDNTYWPKDWDKRMAKYCKNIESIEKPINKTHLK